MNKQLRTASQRDQYAVADTDDVPVIRGAIVTKAQGDFMTQWLKRREGNNTHPWRRRERRKS